MPELPEVETIKESLKETISFKKIKEVEVFCAKLIKFPEVLQFVKDIKNKKIKSLERRGKYLIIKLTFNTNLVVHLGMTGQLIYSDLPLQMDKHTHLLFHFEDNTVLQYRDVRKFGCLWLVKDGCLRFVSGLAQLGPEPLSQEFSMEYFNTILNKKSIIKYLLLSQNNLAGLGNIYVDEILFRAGISPERTAADLSLKEREKLYHTIRSVLEEAIRARGTSVVNYIDSDGKKGSFQDFLRVYRRTGELCFVCSTPIKRIVLAGRGTYFCPKCQPMTSNSCRGKTVRPRDNTESLNQ
ncbi:DNA-formamidopyrimidine glycosylase [Candidatus Contubernalis alkaliaceticus]|uniref:DNA-formamidopyrimidine glycosylase n=1 Tax=Candidatus Contubernalis alkaliaceticus TaxID=338645 RepID=UPI001F4BD5BB|nr:DNA-formamidopyrimidine glycosylase [Candidatus Contubernalis alkalaceticus]UNC91597.1 DNA-formamidopyrimidine glycosylase [Candidatus Contubernalis alkalaceticus]